MSIYQPSDDSYLIQQVLKKYLQNVNKSTNILDMGSGSGILAQTCIEHNFNNIVAVDINEEVIKHLKNQKIKSVQSDLFSNQELKNKKFGLIIFNPPYLPYDKREPKDSQLQTTAGKKGYEIIVQFIKKAKDHLKKDGKILLLFSSLSKPHIILKKAREMKYQYELQASKKLFFEELFVYEFSR